MVRAELEEEEEKRKKKDWLAIVMDTNRVEAGSIMARARDSGLLLLGVQLSLSPKPNYLSSLYVGGTQLFIVP